MGYRITYGKKVIREELRIKKFNWQHIVISVSLSLVFIICIGWIGWTNDILRNMLLPGDPQITEIALEGLVSDVKRGEALSDAITTFCEEILENAQYH